eukprot:XP_014039968.1 PREDICTED: neuropilin-2-like [Salmo salar]
MNALVPETPAHSPSSTLLHPTSRPLMPSRTPSHPLPPPTLLPPQNPKSLRLGPLIGRYCGTKIPPEITSSTGILSLSFHTDMAVAKDGFSARYNMTHKEVSDTFHCSNALGLESGKISDDQITASSSFYDNTWLPWQARLNNGNNAWTPNEDSSKEYIQVRLHV